ncbi:recombinase family protein [Candidatus Avelusimicrobium fimicolum]|uniref:recombinase family protein n=1 Tax=Candidatus Avelusimicrobium fimicolum TaxID=3416216 RepID=UPI003D0B16C6
MPQINCAIYTRKSTEHGLDMEFNSLQNQEESCKAYILSQAFNGWEYTKTYSDGGISGGTMERPGLQTLLNDIREGHIQVVVVYKVDRLSRSIIDFHKMMQEFDKYGCNFVSITQSFDTSNSMGKLTLNMLLSFAQFEREVSAERVRDKIAASKAKGLWMGGTPPLGYDLKDKQLIPNPQEAELVNLIFNKYLELENMLAVAEWLNQNGYYTKCWMPRGSHLRGGKAFQKSSIQRILTNPVYIGKVAHQAKNKIYMGRHAPIVPKNVWEAVQDTVRRRIMNPNAFSHYQTHKTVLAGKLYDDKGQTFRLTSSKKKGKKFLYYYNGVGGHYLPVEQLDSFVLKTLKMTDFGDLEPLADRDRLTDSQMQNWIEKAICQSMDKTHYLSIFLNEKQVKADLSACPRVSGPAESRTISAERLDGTLYIRNTFVVDNVSSVKLQNGSARNILTVRQLNESLLRGVARGWQLKKRMEQGIIIRELEQEQHMTKRTIMRYINLCYLSPRIVADILEYKNPANLTLRELMNLADSQMDFAEQEKVWSQ